MRTRLQQFLQAENMSPSRFADQIGIQRSGVSHILSGRNKPGFDFIEKMLLAYPSLNAEWLITGKGKMYKEAKSASLFSTEAEPEPVPAFDEHKDIVDEKTSPEEYYDSSSEVTHKLVKVLLFYSDNTFSAYSPGDVHL